MLDKLALEQKVQAFKNQMPEYKNYNDEQILSVMVQCGYITEDELREISSFYKTQGVDNTGLTLQANRSLDDVLLKDNSNNLVFESKDGKRYNLNAVLNQHFGAVKTGLKTAEDSNGWIGKLWSGTKNLFGFGDSSNKVREQQDREQQLLAQFNADNPNKAQIFKELTGLDFTPENIEAFITGEAKLKSEQALDGYKEGQEMASDMGGDIISGIAAVGIYSLAVAAIPLTGGLSLAAGFAAAGIAGGLVKQGVKWTDGKQPNRKDFVTGAVSGLLAPFTGGLGGAVGKSVAKTLGIQAVKQMGKEGAEVAAIAAGKQAAKGGFKKWAMTTFTNPTGYQYGAKTQGIKGLLNLFTTKLGWKKVGATASEMMVDGALGGGLDGAFRAGYVEGADAEGMLQAGIMGFVGGAALAPVIGGGMKAVGKLGHKAGFKGPVAKLSDDELIKSYKEFPDNPNFLTAEQSETLAQVSEELTKRGLLKQGELIEPKGKPLEGNIGDKELDEVAPFAKHAEEEPQVGDIVLPDKSKHVLEDGIYDKDGNFIPDGIVTTYEGGKSVTRKIMPNGASYTVATTFKDLVKQLKRDLKREKFSKGQLETLKRFFENNPDFKVSDLSEMFINAKCLHWQHSLFEHISYLSNARTVRDNLNILAKFDSTPERSTLRISKQLQELNKDYRFFDELGKTDSELLSKNLELLDEMSYGIKEDEYFYLKKFLFKEHHPQLKERIKLVREFNDSLTEFNQTANEYHGGLNRLERHILDVLESDKNFATLKEKMEVVKEAYKYSPEWAQNMLRDHYNPSQAPAFKLFIQALPEGKRFERILRTFANLQDSSPERAAKYLEFCQNIPEDRLAQMVKNETYNNCNKVWNELLRYNIKPEELDQLIQKAKILSKFPKIIGTVGWSSYKSPDMSQVERILLATYDEPLEKIVQFLDLADERYLAHYNMEMFQATFMTGRNIDTMLENARLHQDLNPDFVKFINTKREGGYYSQKYLDYSFDSKETKTRIEAINNLYGKLDNKILEDIYFGKLPCRKNVLDAIAQIDPDTYKAITQYRQIEKFDQFSDSALEILPDLLNRLKPYKEKERYCNFDENVLSDNFINLINNITREEINCINPQSFIKLRFSDHTFDPKIIRENFAQIPPNIREIVSMADTDCNILSSYGWFYKEGPDKIIRAKAAFDYISSAIESGSLTLDDFKRLGPTYLKRFIDNYSNETGAKSVNLEGIKFLRELPLDFLQRAEDYLPNLLKLHSELDPNVVTSRFNHIVRNYPENSALLNSTSLYTMAVARKEKFAIIDKLLKYKYDNKKAAWDPMYHQINSAIDALPSSKVCQEEYDYILKTLIDNPDNDLNFVYSQLSYIFPNYNIDANLYNLRKDIVKTLISEKGLSPKDTPSLFFNIGYVKNAEIEDLIFKDILKRLRRDKVDSEYITYFYRSINDFELESSKTYLECLDMLVDNIPHAKIRDFLQDFEPNNIACKKRMLNLLCENKHIDSEHWHPIVVRSNEVNEDLAKLLCKDKNFPGEFIADILKHTNEANIKLAETLCKDKNFPSELIANILDNTNEANIKLAETLCKDKNFPSELIANILDNTNEANIKLAETLCKDKNFSGELITEILRLTDETNIKLAEILCKDKSFPQDKITFLLGCKIYSEVSPQIIIEKTKKFMSLGLEDSFIKDILENSSSLTFYSDDVLKILSKRKANDPKISIREMITALSGPTPAKLQDRIDTLITLAKFSEEEISVFKKQGVDVNKKIETLEELIDARHHLISTTKDDVHAFLKAFANTDAADNIIRNADFEQFGKQGIQLQYSREAFTQRMNELSGINYAREIQHSADAEIPPLKMTDDDILKSKEALESFRNRFANNTQEYDVIINGEETKITRFCGSKIDGSNDGDFAQIGDKLYYVKFPSSDKLEQSVQEVMASELYRAAGIDAPNMKVIFDKDGRILGMASEYIPNIGGSAQNKDLFDSFIADAWLADWDAPKHGNSVMRNGTCLKMDVGGSMEYRARGEKKLDFGDIVNELTTLIEQNADYINMTKTDVLASIQHVTSVTDDQIWKIINGMPAEYRNFVLGQKICTRRDYIRQFSQVLEQLDETKYESILDLMNDAKLQTTRSFQGNTNVASLLGYEQTALGFEGLLNTRDLSKLNLSPQELATAQKMILEIENFTKYNRVADNVPLPNEVKNFLNNILRGVPEFAAYFSKPQHSVHNYSLEIHILKVLQDSLRDPDYQKLSDQDKMVLKFSTLLHDIGKKWLGTKDTGHASLSAEYALSILDRFNLSDDMKDRIISIVDNHHWFKDYCTGTLDAETIATLARRPQDWLIYKIMAKADLINVSEKHALDKVKGATSMADIWQVFEKNVAEIENQVQRLREKQVVVTSTTWTEVPKRTINGKELPARTFGKKTATIDGAESEFKVLNLKEISDEEDMFQYGFNHILKKALRFIVHMPGDGSVKSFNIFRTLARNPLNYSAQSLSMISADNTSTYCGRRFGFILDVNNANISHAYYSNTGSGTNKGIRHFVREIFEEGKHRDFVKKQFIEFLKTERGIELDDMQYAKITKYIMGKTYPETQLRGNITIGEKTYKADDLVDAFTFSRDQLLEITQQKTHGDHNELVGLNAKIKGLVAKVDSFEELPEYFLRFARDNNLPIILVGY